LGYLPAQIEPVMSNEILLLKKQILQLQLGLIGCVALILLFMILSFTDTDRKSDIIRARGIIIEDREGRDRILIGAPLPASSDRVRTDTALVRKHWAKNYRDPDQFMKWYRDYRHSAIGMVVLNEEGFDRIQIGDQLSDPNSGKRMFEAAGLLWNDREGWEKGGAGVNTTNEGKARSVIGLDDSQGEAVHIIALEDGTKGLIIGGENGRLMIGMSEKDGQWFQNTAAYTGIKYFNTDGKLVWEQNMSDP
jgi:hypothetical protein